MAGDSLPAGGVSCADCHMPYKSEGGGGVKIHRPPAFRVRSITSPIPARPAPPPPPTAKSEQELIRNVIDRQDMVKEVRVKLEEILVGGASHG